ncbi:MAG: sulfite exporter TauE/SafE family protein [Candidatus Zixiibacteriota bacterium]
MPDSFLYLLGGFSAGLLGGYLGLGGGEIMVPFLTVIAGVDIKSAVPVSVTAIVVNSFSASNEYLKKGMVDFELVIVLAIFLVMGNIAGSNLSFFVPADYVKLLLTVLLVYTAFSLLKGRTTPQRLVFSDNRTNYLQYCLVLALLVGTLAGLVGIGGGVFLIPILYLLVGLPLTTARGTSSLMICFASASATAVYFMNDMIEYSIASPVIVGIALGGKLGGFFGTAAKPIIIRIVFFLLMIYLAYGMARDPLQQLL